MVFALMTSILKATVGPWPIRREEAPKSNEGCWEHKSPASITVKRLVVNFLSNGDAEPTPALQARTEIADPLDNNLESESGEQDSGTKIARLMAAKFTAWLSSGTRHSRSSDLRIREH